MSANNADAPTPSPTQAFATTIPAAWGVLSGKGTPNMLLVVSRLKCNPHMDKPSRHFALFGAGSRRQCAPLFMVMMETYLLSLMMLAMYVPG